MSINYEELKTEIETDPKNLGYTTYVTSGSDEDLAKLLNKKKYSRFGLLKIGLLSAWMTVNGIRKKIKNGSENFVHPEPEIQEKIRELCSDVLGIERNPHMDVLDLKDVETQSLIGTLADLGIVTQEEKNSLFSRASYKISRGEELFGEGTNISNSDISFALRGNK